MRKLLKQSYDNNFNVFKIHSEFHQTLQHYEVLLGWRQASFTAKFQNKNLKEIMFLTWYLRMVTEESLVNLNNITREAFLRPRFVLWCGR